MDLYAVVFGGFVLAVVCLVIVLMMREALKHTQPVDVGFCYSSMEDELRNDS